MNLELLNIATNVRRLREQHDLSQAQLAEAASVAERTIQRAEGRVSVKSDSLRRMADALGVPVDTLRKPPPLSEQGKRLTDEQKRWEVVQLQPIDRGKALVPILSGSHAMGFQSAELDNESDEDAVAAFEQVVRDWGDLLDELEPLQRRDAEKSLDAEIAELRNRGLAVTGARRRYRVRLGQGESPFTGKPLPEDPLPWDIAYIVVSRSERPTLALVRDRSGPLF